MQEKIKSYIDKIKRFFNNNKFTQKIFNYFKNLNKKQKKIIIGSFVGILIFSIGLTVFLNFNGNSYKILYPGIESKESLQILEVLQSMEVPAKLDKSGHVMVQSKDYNRLLLELTAKGYPKSAPAYGIFKENSGFSTTEFEKRQYLLFNLQDKLVQTIEGIDGVKSADVNIVVPEDGGYVLNNSKSVSTAAVTVHMRPGYELSGEKVNSVKNLVSHSVPKMTAENVTVVDGTTGVTLNGVDSNKNTSTTMDNLGFQLQVENMINDKVKNILSAGFPLSDLRISSTAEIDYDKMLTEKMEYQPAENGEGIKTNFEESYNRDNANGDVAGQENNTNIPTYNNQGDNPNNTSYNQKADYAVSYIKQQIEKGQAALKSASVSVTVSNGNFDEQATNNYIAAVSKATNIPAESISIVGVPRLKTTNPALQDFFNNPVNIAVFVGVLILLAIAFVLMKKRKKASLVGTVEQDIVGIDPIVEESKNMMELAKNNAEKENVVLKEIKQFVGENPDITASLIKNWLKEDE